MKTHRTFQTLFPLLAAVLLTVPAALASFHTWKVNEIYSNADGSVQFIELKESSGFDSQHLLPGHSITCTGTNGTRTFNFPANLPNSGTANKFFVIGTSNLSSMPGGLIPDYVFTNTTPFLSLNGGSINFASGFDIVTYTNLPSNGVGAMIRSGANMIVVTSNSPVNFLSGTNSLVALRFASIAQGGTNIVLSFATAAGTNGIPGPNYAVQFNDDLTSTNWTTLTNLTGNGTIREVTNPISAGSARIFRLRVP